jgi:drug/metabolite transporter (DMT)-like permease
VSTAASPTRAPAPTAGFPAMDFLGCSIGWASGYLFIKLGSVGVSPPVVAAMRGLIAAVGITLFFALQRRAFWPRGREWRDWAVLGLLNGWGPNVLVAFALDYIGTAPAVMISASNPLMVAVLAHAMFADERLTPRRGIGLLVGFAGMGVLIGPAAFGAVNATGALAMVGVAVSYALGTIYVRTIPQLDPARLALGQQVFSGVPVTVLALAALGPTAFDAVPQNAAALIALGLISTALPNLLYMRLIRRAGPTRAAMVSYLVPVWTALLAIAFLGETISLREITGGAVVLAGVAIVSSSGRDVDRSPERR